jgi:hypothetical protein
VLIAGSCEGAAVLMIMEDGNTTQYLNASGLADDRKASQPAA